MADIVNKAGTNVGNGYKLIGASPLDVRLVVADIAERDSIVTANGCYPGLEVWVESEGKQYCAIPKDDTYEWKETSLIEDIPKHAITGTGTKDYIPIFTEPMKLGNSVISQATSNKTTIGGKLVVNAGADKSTGNCDEGIRVLPASGWAEVFLSNDTNTTGTGGWLIARRGSNGSTSGALGDFTIEYGGWQGNGLTLYANGNRPRWKNNELAYKGDISDKTITLAAGNGLTDGGAFTLNQATDETITFNVGAGNGITVTENAVAAKAGNGITVDTIGINHADTSTLEGAYGPSAGGTQASKKTMDIIVPQITVDGYGHVTAVTNKTFTVTDTDTGATTVSITGDGNAFTNAEYNASARTITFTKGSTFLTAESDTLQTVTTRGATTDKAITTAGLTTTSTLYVTGTTGHREGIRIAPFENLSSIWWNATGTRDYTTGQMWGITAYDKGYNLDATKTNTFRFRGPDSSTATSATDQMWINTSGLVTSRGGFAKSGSSDSYVLLAGGGTKALSEFGIGTGGSLDLSNYVDLTSPQTISGNKTFTGNVITSNNKFEIKATGNTDDSWIKLTNASDDGYYAFGIRRPYNTYGLQLKIKAAGKPESEAEYYDIWNANNHGSGSGLDADKLDGQEGTYYLDYNNFTNKPTIPDPTKYYWADIQVSSTSNTATTPSVQKIGITGSTTATANAAVTLEYDTGLKALKFVFA